MKLRADKKGTETLTASRLRMDVYRVLDQVLETGAPAVVQRRGKLLRIVPAESVDRLKRLRARPEFIKGDPEAIVHLDWSSEWRP